MGGLCKNRPSADWDNPQPIYEPHQCAYPDDGEQSAALSGGICQHLGDWLTPDAQGHLLEFWPPALAGIPAVPHRPAVVGR